MLTLAFATFKFPIHLINFITTSIHGEMAGIFVEFIPWFRKIKPKFLSGNKQSMDVLPIRVPIKFAGFMPVHGAIPQRPVRV